jgi:hypothetical protein
MLTGIRIGTAGAVPTAFPRWRVGTRKPALKHIGIATMQLLLDLPEEQVIQLQLIKNKGEFISQAIATALRQYHQPEALPTLDTTLKPHGHVLNTLTLLNSPEFKELPFGDVVEIEKTILQNRTDWND